MILQVFKSYRGKLPSLLLLGLLLLSCGQETREEVVERYQDGAKKKVAIYEGQGKSESLIEVRKYSKSGALTKLVDKKSGSTKRYYKLNESISTAAGLKKVIVGKTWSRSIDAGKDYIQFTKDSVYYAVRSANGESTLVVDYAEAKYLDNYEVKRTNKEIRLDTLKVLPLSNKKIKIPNFKLFEGENKFSVSRVSAKKMVRKNR